MNTFKKLAKKLRPFITTTRLVIVAIVIGVIVWQVFKTEKIGATHSIDRGLVERVVIASGKVEVSNQAVIGFQQSGTVSRVLVKSGSKVKAGDMIAQLDLGTLSADLRDARATLAEAQYKKQKSELDVAQKSGLLGNDSVNTKANLDALRTKLLSTDLELYPENSSQNSSVAPIISGTYKLEKDSASYKVSLYPSAGESGVSATIVGEGISQTVALSTSYPSPIGSTGLYIRLPLTGTVSANTNWLLDLPNKRSVQYVSNLYQYLDAKRNYQNSITNQENEISLISEGFNEYDIAIERARASIDRVQQSIRLRGLYTPVSGTVGRIDLTVGQSVTQGVSVATILGNGQLETKLKVPEASIGGVHLDDPVIISPDINPEIMYEGTIATIDQAETYVEGTPVYETRVNIDNSDILRPGMTVRGKITIDKRQDVLRVPDLALFPGTTSSSFIIKKILTENSSKTTDIPVQILLRGTDGLVAIEGAVSVGDTVLLREESTK